MDDAHNPYASPDPDAAPVQRGPLLEVEIDLSRAVIAEGAFTYEDLLQATKLDSRSRLWARVGVVILGLLFAFGGFLLWIKVGMIGLLAFIVGLGFLVYSVIKAPSQSATRLWNTSRSLREPFRRVITQDVIQAMGADYNATLNWSNYCKYRQSDDLVLLYLTDHPKLFSIFARHTFADDAGWEQFCAWVNEKLPPD